MIFLTLHPISLCESIAFLARLNQRGKSVTGQMFSIACVDEHGAVHGVAIVGRPASRCLNDGMSLEVRRLCTDGTDNVDSMLYTAVWRVTQAMGYKRLFPCTYGTETSQGITTIDCYSKQQKEGA